MSEVTNANHSTPRRVLFVDDEEKLGKILKRAAESFGGWTAEASVSSEDALGVLKQTAFDVVVSDIRMGAMDGMQLLGEIKKIRPDTRVVLMTAYGTIENAVAAIKRGADDYLVKPVKIHELKRLLNRLVQAQPSSVAVHSEAEVECSDFSFSSIVAESPGMRKVVEMARRAADKSATILLRGESGTGKDLLAQVIHFSSLRRRGPFIKAVCAAIPEGLLESDLFGHTKGAFTGATDAKPGRFQLADKGTIFLDEIGDMTPNTQVKLLRVIQDREFEPVGSAKTIKVDVRVIAATNRDLEEARAQSKFREDLYYRLNVVALNLPPLRERREDVRPLIDRFLKDYARKERCVPFSLSTEVLSLLDAYTWPGNVRELQNALEHAQVMATSSEVSLDDLPLYLQTRDSEPARSANVSLLEGLTLEDIEKEMIRKALERSGGNISKAAEFLGITRRTMGYRREKYGL